MGIGKNRKFTLYVLTFPNGMAYVGITSQNIEERWNYGKGYKHQPVNEGIEEFGWENVKKNVIAENLDMEDAKRLEREYIAKYGKTGVYNKTSGGECGSLLTSEFEYNGEMLSSREIAELSSVPGLDYHDITTRVNHHGWDLETAMTQKKMRKDTKFKYKDGEYTIHELMQFCKVSNLTENQLRTRIMKLEWDIDRALTQPNNVKIQPKGIGENKYFYNNKWCNSYDLFLMRKDERITQSDIVSRIERSGWSIEDAISKSPKKMNRTYLYRGKQCSSKELEALSPVGLQYNTIVSRIKLGWSVEEAVELPSGSKPSKKFK